MSEYSQELRLFVINCPSSTVIAQKLMTKINEAADRLEAFEKSHEELLEACDGLIVIIQYMHTAKDYTTGAETLQKRLEKAEQVLTRAKELTK